MASDAQTFDEFWLYYLRVHSRGPTRRLHFLAITVAVAGIALSLVVGDYGLFAVGGIVTGYLLAWTAHALVEHNRPAFFKGPVWSLVCGLRMYGLWLIGRLEPELRRAGVV